MTAGWTWSYADSSAEAIAPPEATTAAFPTQGEAEAWFAESWVDLAQAGVSAVTLHQDGVTVYGPMSLEPPA